MSYDSNNIFARILRQEIPCKKIHENNFGLAFHDINPKAPIHALVIPRGAYTSSLDFHEKASTEEITGFYRFVSDVVRLLDLPEKGYRLLSNHGTAAGQEVPHYHVHIFGGKPLGPMLKES